MRKILVLNAAAFFLAISAAAQVTAIRAGRLIDTDTGAVFTDQVILVRGGQIEKVGKEREIQIPADAEIVDLSKMTVLPGLIDCHTQIGRAHV